MREALRAGLDRVALLPVAGGYLEASAGARGAAGAVVGYVRGELGWRPVSRAAFFAFGEAELGRPGPAWAAGLGARVTW